MEPLRLLPGFMVATISMGMSYTAGVYMNLLSVMLVAAGALLLTPIVAANGWARLPSGRDTDVGSIADLPQRRCA